MAYTMGTRPRRQFAVHTRPGGASVSIVGAGGLNPRSCGSAENRGAHTTVCSRQYETGGEEVDEENIYSAA